MSSYYMYTVACWFRFSFGFLCMYFCVFYFNYGQFVFRLAFCGIFLLFVLILVLSTSAVYYLRKLISEITVTVCM